MLFRNRGVKQRQSLHNKRQYAMMLNHPSQQIPLRSALDGFGDPLIPGSLRLMREQARNKSNSGFAASAGRGRVADDGSCNDAAAMSVHSAVNSKPAEIAFIDTIIDRTAGVARKRAPLLLNYWRHRLRIREQEVPSPSPVLFNWIGKERAGETRALDNVSVQTRLPDAYWPAWPKRQRQNHNPETDLDFTIARFRTRPAGRI